MTSPTSTSSSLTLTEEQSVAVQSLLDFIADPDPAQPLFTFSGSAGTGKTFCMREVVARLSGTRAKIVFTAPTNKAAKVLRSITKEACTIYSLLGLRIDKSGELKLLTTGHKPPDLSDLDVVFLDEASMVNTTLFNMLLAKATEFQFKVVFLGDKAQLPPVGEASSPVWKLPNGASLSTVMRHDNQILTLATALRATMHSLTPCITITNDNAGGEGVFKLAKAGFKKALWEAASNGEFADGSKSKVIAWRNVTVGVYNDLIRTAIFGAIAIQGEYLLGERIVAAAPCSRGDEPLMMTDEEAIVEGAVNCQHPLVSKYASIELKCRTEDNRLVRLLVLHPSSKAQYEQDSTHLAHEAKGNGKLWKKFWEHKELFHDVKYAYALTAHRSQGSTYENVWVDYQDILLNRNRLEAFQCLYVAATRPTKRLYLA